MQAARPPFLRGVLLLAALAAIAFIMARGDNPAQATTYNPHSSVSVSDSTPGAAADIVINFSLDAPDSFPNVRTNSSIQFIPRQWDIHVPETEEEERARVGGIAGTFNALPTLGIGGRCFFPIPVPFTMYEASPHTGYDPATGAYDPQKLTSSLDIGGGLGPGGSDLHPGGVGYSGQFVNDPNTVQPAGDLGQSLFPFNDNEMRDTAGSTFEGYPMVDGHNLYRDMDGDGRVSVGDVRLTPWFNLTGANTVFPAGSVVEVGDNDMGGAGYDQPGLVLARLRADEKRVDPNNNGQMDPEEQGIYRDVDGSNTVSLGDIRLFHTTEMPFGTVVQTFALPAGVTRYPDFLNEMFDPAEVGDPLARMYGNTNVLNVTAVSLNIVTYRPGQLPGYPATLGYPSIVVLLDPVAPIELVSINSTPDLCTSLALVSTNLGVSKDNPATLANEGGYVRLTNPKAEKEHTFTLVTTSQPDADNDNIENMLDSCPLTPNTQDLDGHISPILDGDNLDGSCDPDPVGTSPDSAGGYIPKDEDVDSYRNAGDNCSTTPNGVEYLDQGYVQVNAFVFFYAITGDPVGPSNQIDTDGDDIGDACEGAESGGPGAAPADQQCVNAGDDDGDGAVNDGCPTVAFETGTQCLNALDDDADGAVNDGCLQYPLQPGETGGQCLNAIDDDGDGKINDGCPRVGTGSETGLLCNNAIDDDNDGYVNDGCPQFPRFPAESGAKCANALDDDGDGYVNDGCTVVGTLGAAETACDNNTDDDGDGFVNDGCPAADPGDVAKTTITGHMHVETRVNAVPIFKHGVKLNQLGGPKTIKDNGARTYSVDVSNLSGSVTEDVQVALKVAEGCAAVSGPSSVSVGPGGSGSASFTVDFTGCAAGEYTVQADACHAGDAAPAGLFGSGACPGTSDGMTDPNPLDDAPIAKSVEVGSP